VSLSDYEIRVLAQLEHELKAMGRSDVSGWRAARRRRVITTSWVLGALALFGIAVVAPSVTLGVWVAVGTALVLTGASVLVSDGVRALKDSLRG
jgi:hypothetical protein